MIDELKQAMADVHPEYNELPESIKMIHPPDGFKWLGDEKYRVVERETQPDFDVVE